MKKSLSIIASMAALVALAGCPGGSPNTNTSPTPSPSASSSTPNPGTSATPDPGTSATPTPGPTGPTATPTPLPSGSALPTPPPATNTGFSITGATAVKQSDFSYVFTISGTDLGAVGDYSNLEAEVSGSTVKLVSNGQSLVNNVELRALTIAPGSITFRWLPPNGAPTPNDFVKLNYTKNNDSAKTSTGIRLSVQ